MSCLHKLFAKDKNKSYNYPIECIMNYLYDLNTNFDEYSLYILNKYAGQIVTPNTVIKDIFNSSIRNLTVKIYGVRWLQEIEIHFPISNNFFLCTSKQINDHMIAYLIDENILYDNTTKKYLWNQTLIKKRDQQYYDIECFSDKFHNACQNFKQQI
ncbi:unnamed protein product [Rotaria sordida]|uniref:Uncharacterized protein n=1 Tax=Rotaria sordida TaxID=392033 RepID=A0A819IQ64_9BILA|nr:unnamed protein product [Rotaria sordida]